MDMDTILTMLISTYVSASSLTPDSSATHTLSW